MLATLLQMLAGAFAFACVFACMQLAFSRVRILLQSRPQMSLEDVLCDRTLCFLAFCAFGLVISYAISLWLVIPCIVASFVLSKQAPGLLEARRRKELRSTCDEHVDTMADIVAMGVRSGLSFDAALDLYCGKFDNALSKELRDSRLAWTSGLASRQEALAALSSRVDSKALARFAETSLQAIHHGAPLASMLGRFSADVRQRRRAMVEQQIAKAPVKLLIPTGTCILPAMLVLVMGPVLLQFMQTGF